MTKKPIIIDCDPGTDDAIALFMALASKSLDVRAVTVVSGNQTLEKTAKNALDIVSFLKREDVKVAKGARGPIKREAFLADFVHGESGVGNTVFPKAKNDFYKKNAVDTIYEEAIKCEDKLEIVAIGPLTNIATLLLTYPEVKEKIHRIVIMGGAIFGGNDSPAAEFNIYVDPEAARIVFESGIPLVMVGLDATHKAKIFENEIRELDTYNEVGKYAAEIMDFTKIFYNSLGFDGVLLHDPCALAYVIDESILKTEKYHVDIETRGEITRGKTVVDIYRVTGKEPNIEVAVDVDRERFIRLLKELIKSY